MRCEDVEARDTATRRRGSRALTGAHNGSQGVAAGEEHRTRHLSEQEHGVDVVAVEPHAEMHRSRRRVAARCDGADIVPGHHDISGGECGHHRLERRHITVRVFDREQGPVHHGSTERHDPVGRCTDCTARSRDDVDAAVPGSVFVRRRPIRIRDRAGPVERPSPVRGGEDCGGGWRVRVRRDRGADAHKSDEQDDGEDATTDDHRAMIRDVRLARRGRGTNRRRRCAEPRKRSEVQGE